MEKFTYKKMFENEKSFWWYVARRKIIFSAMTKMNVSKGNILELGSGTGGNVSFLSRFGSYTGIEKEQIAINYAKTKFPDTKFIQGALPQIFNEITEKYNTIVLLDVIEHIEDDLKTLKSTASLLKENGFLIMTMPAFPFLWSNHDVVHHHHRRYTKKALFTLCQDSGYSIKYHSYFNFLLFPIILSIRFFKKIFNLKSSDDKPTSNIINKVLIKIFGFESLLIPHLRLPFGLSHIIILKKMTDK